MRLSSQSVALAFALVMVVAGFGVLGLSPAAAELGMAAPASDSSQISGLNPANSPISAELSISPTQLDVGQVIHVVTTPSGGNPSPDYSFEYTNMPGGCQTDEQQTFSCSPSENGVFHVNVTVSDNNGNMTTSNTVILTVDPGVMASLSVSPNSVTEGNQINLQTTASGGSGSYSYTYFGLPPGCNSSNSPSFSCSPSATGPYSIYVNVTDSNGGYYDSGTQNLQVTSSSGNNGNGGNGNGGNGNGGGGNNSSNPFSSLLSGFSGFLSILLIVGIIGFVSWILLIVGVWIIAIVLIRRLPRRGAAGVGPIGAPTGKCPSCSSAIPAGSKFCPECGASAAPKGA
jgi:hypothetical protein